jgi:hypothetical protein
MPGTEAHWSRDVLAQLAGTSAISLSHSIIHLSESLLPYIFSSLLTSLKLKLLRSYSRAYIHHLLVSHELLAEVMLYRHNLCCSQELFRSAQAYMRQVAKEECITTSADM